MMSHGRLGYDRAKSLLKQSKLRLGFIQMSVFKSTDPATPERISDTLEAKYRQIGVGIVQKELPSGEKFLWTTVLLGTR